MLAHLKESQTGPLPNDRKKSKCIVILILRKFRGGPVEGFMGGGQSRDIFRGGPVKKTPCNSDLFIGGWVGVPQGVIAPFELWR